jgi:hypothetical protein
MEAKCRQKFPLRRRANHLHLSGRPALLNEGRFAIVTGVGRGLRWTLGVRQDEAHRSGRRSRGVLVPRRWYQVGDDALHRDLRWRQKAGLQEDHEGNR